MYCTRVLLVKNKIKAKIKKPMVDYLGHSITEGTSPSPEPGETDAHFKVIYKQNKAAIAARGPQNATATRIDSVPGSFTGDASFLGFGTYRFCNGCFRWCYFP